MLKNVFIPIGIVVWKDNNKQLKCDKSLLKDQIGRYDINYINIFPNTVNTLIILRLSSHNGKFS